MEAEMDRGVIQVYYGEGHGKSTAAIGNAIRIASEGKSVIIIQFLKGKNENELTFLSRLEPEIKIFRFAKSDECFEALSEEAKQEESMNLRNGFNYGKKSRYDRCLRYANLRRGTWNCGRKGDKP